MSEHSPEPWQQSKVNGLRVEDAESGMIGHTYYGPMTKEQAVANARRIVACVNACRYLPTDYLEWLAAEDRFLVGTSLKCVGACMAEFEKIVGEDRLKELAPLYNRLVDDLVDRWGGDNE